MKRQEQAKKKTIVKVTTEMPIVLSLIKIQNDVFEPGNRNAEKTDTVISTGIVLGQAYERWKDMSKSIRGMRNNSIIQKEKSIYPISNEKKRMQKAMTRSSFFFWTVNLAMPYANNNIEKNKIKPFGLI